MDIDHHTLTPAVAPLLLLTACASWCLSAEFEEAAELLSADPGAPTLSMSASNTTTTAGGQDVKLDLSEDEEGQEESSEVCKVSACADLRHRDTG